ncbi:MAG TPA: hypothetical protein VNQ90_06450 [Chthoniobacteraceae bacterium]|nr:hypothetical protein [Chthoniobacteraceae bacterium]
MLTSLRPAPFAKRAFTLLEALITIGVVGVLVSLLLPVLGKVAEGSLNSKCMTNLRQLGAAGLLYAAEQNGRLPDRGGWGGTTQPHRSLLPYLNLPLRNASAPVYDVDSVLTCPSVQKSRFRTPYDWHRTYAINQYATGDDAGTASIRQTWVNHVENRDAPLRLTNVREPAAQSFFMDGPVLLEAGGYRYSMYQAPDRLEERVSDDETAWRTPWVHGATLNVVFLDGHIEAISREYAERELIGATNPAASTKDPRRRHPFWGAGK